MRYAFLIAIALFCSCERQKGAAVSRQVDETDDLVAREVPNLSIENGAPVSRQVDETDDLFVAREVPSLSIEIPDEGMKVLREYQQVWRQARPERRILALAP